MKNLFIRITHRKRNNFLLLVFLISAVNFCFAQNSGPTKGVVLDAIDHTALPYVNILILKNNRGTISNEKGDFSIDLSDLLPKDTISFQFIGYKTKSITLEQLNTSNTILLSEDIMSIDEVFITNKKMSAEDIVKNVLKNKNTNYVTSFHKDQIFVRERYITDVNQIQLDYKKSTIQEIKEETLRDFENKTPKHSTSYFDFLANFYIDGAASELKLEPIKAVELTSKNLAELENYKKLFDQLFLDTSEKEYWKIKSGIFGEKLDVQEDTLTKPEHSDNRPIEFYKYQIEEKIEYVTFKDKDLWEFLHKTGRYNFKLEGTTTTGGESVYIISFTAKKKGLFEGELFITTDTYALLKASYKYSKDKTGKNFNLFGVGYTESDFQGSIYFEKNAGNYQLKYFSYNKNYNIRINRKIALQKKRSRFLFDKKLKELKLRLNLNLQVQEAIEYFSIKTAPLTQPEYNSYKESKNMNVLHIDQFDENLWQGYDIIEPTKQIKQYKKIQ